MFNKILRSAGEWSAGVPTEQSILHAYIDAIEKAEHFIYIEVQFVYMYVLVYILCLFVQVAGTAISQSLPSYTPTLPLSYPFSCISYSWSPVSAAGT